MTSPSVLLVDDDPSLLRVLEATFVEHGFDVRTAVDGEGGLDALADSPVDVVVLDLGLPDIDGLEVCRLMRRLAPSRIVVLSADGAEERKVAALDSGADDYVTKPFSTAELLARVRVSVRHRAELAVITDTEVIELGPLRIDLAGHAALVGSEALDLTQKEFALLSVLAQNAGRLVSHRRLLARVWGNEHSVNSLRIHVSHLRRKLDSHTHALQIESELGVGYRLVLLAAGG